MAVSKMASEILLARAAAAQAHHAEDGVAGLPRAVEIAVGRSPAPHSTVDWTMEHAEVADTGACAGQIFVFRRFSNWKRLPPFRTISPSFSKNISFMVSSSILSSG